MRSILYFQSKCTSHFLICIQLESNGGGGTLHSPLSGRDPPSHNGRASRARQGWPRLSCQCQHTKTAHCRYFGYVLLLPLSFCFFDAEFYVTSWLENPFSGELDRDDIELLLHFFWLPHSHGPKAQITLNYFKQLLEDAHIIQKLGLYNKRDGEMVDEPHGYKNLSNEWH